ncbi:MAG: CRISPR-associated helicase Cas3' [Deltaproteobacteria bacterium]|nr:CRISPR-associated helicase Cas3' [Deltaproteobacteria bacterium]
MAHYAHSLEGQPKAAWQCLEDHLRQVGELAAYFATDFGAGSWGLALGRLHDLGKFSGAFQKRLAGGPRVDHATAGAREALARWGEQKGRLLAYALAGHHGGLPDWVDPGGGLKGRLTKEIPDYRHFPPTVLTELKLGAPRLRFEAGRSGFQTAFFCRMLFSCLVDADFLDTEAFMDPQKAGWRGGRPGLPALQDRLKTFLAGLRQREQAGPLNPHRNRILEACLQAASKNPGLFSLTVPTGGGKTIASLAFGLAHALAHGLERIIYVIPYTSIIEQNAAVFREILGADAVVEHHASQPVPRGEDLEETHAYLRTRLAAENWDAPLVVTTNVQLFESLFANRPSRCRKLHRLSRSVIILDEAQMLPREALLPCLHGLKELALNYGASVVLMTATQPAFGDGVTLGSAALQAREIAPDPLGLQELFRRVEVHPLGGLSDAELAARLVVEPRVLAIVNTRAHARSLYEQCRELAGAAGLYHLSALMTPAHRSRKLAEIRQALARGRTCRVVSTQLVECGVDLDFPVVFRALAGLDSLAQAAGRCNREGRLAGLGRLYVFAPEGVKPPPSLRPPAETAAEVLPHFPDPLGLEAVHEFFELLFWREKDLLDRANLVETCQQAGRKLTFPFATMARDFSYFDSPGEAVLVCLDPALREEIIQGLRYASSPGKYLRQAQPHVVQLYPHELAALEARGVVERLGEGLFPVLMNLDAYDRELGLVVGRTEEMATHSLVL